MRFLSRGTSTSEFFSLMLLMTHCKLENENRETSKTLRTNLLRNRVIDSKVLKFDHFLQSSKQLANVLLASFHPNIIRSPADIPIEATFCKLQAHTITHTYCLPARNLSTSLHWQKGSHIFLHSLCGVRIPPMPFVIFRSTSWQDHAHPNGAVSESHGVGTWSQPLRYLATETICNLFSYGSPLCYFSKGKSGIKWREALECHRELHQYQSKSTSESPTRWCYSWFTN